MEEEKKETEVIDKVTEEAEKLISAILEEGIQASNIEFLYKIVDIHKDIANEKYWKEKEEEIMRYRGYGEDSYGEYRGNPYNEGSYRDGSYGEYSEGGSYGRRGVKGTGRGRYRGGQGSGRYRGHEMIDEMAQHYGNYSESRENYNESGSYGAKEDSKKYLQYMLESVEDFMMMLEQEADSEEEVQMIKKTARKISEM